MVRRPFRCCGGEFQRNIGRLRNNANRVSCLAFEGFRHVEIAKVGERGNAGKGGAASAAKWVCGRGGNLHHYVARRNYHLDRIYAARCLLTMRLLLWQRGRERALIPFASPGVQSNLMRMCVLLRWRIKWGDDAMVTVKGDDYWEWRK